MTEQVRPNQDVINLEVGSIYDVFLGFREYDSFFIATMLYHRLKDTIRVFKDNGNPYSSQEIPLQFCSSKIFLPIFSKAYASSPRCLETLALMVEHKSRSGGKKEILAVFYDVERSDLQLEKESLYTDALDKQRGISGAEQVERWKKALVEAGKAEGWEVSSNERYDGVIQPIVEHILLKLNKLHNYVPRELFKGDRPKKKEFKGADPMLSYKESTFTLDGMHGVNDSLGGTSSEAHSGLTFEGGVKSSGSSRTPAHSKRMFRRMALSSGTYSTSELEARQVLKIISLLEMDVNGVRVIGIHGRDGIGKTALAKVVYNKISIHFDACSFLAEIKETMRHPGGVQHLQTKLIFDILKREYEVASTFKGIRFLKEIFRKMKVLLVLDDLENGSLLKEFVGPKLDWFGSGSRIIVTTTQRSILQGFVDPEMACTYNVSPMDGNLAFNLFWQYATGLTDQLYPYVESANVIVKAAEGLPLLVKVFGSFLHGKGPKEWMKFKDLVQQFQEDYQKILRIIYEALEEQQKRMFLDIACFLPDVECRIASYVWHDYDRPHDEIEVLHRMSLIKKEENKIGMHSMLRCLARKIIYEVFRDPEACVRFYIPTMAHDTKKRKRGTDHLNTIMAGFEILPSMIFLSLGCVNIGGRLAAALLNVRWLHWQGCPRDFVAISIHLGNLVILDLSWSKVKESWGGWKGIKMDRLKVLNLTGCVDLLVTPSFSCYPNLEILILEQCSRLVHLDPSIGDLKLLVTLNLKFCSELSMLPVEMDGMKALEELLIDATSVRELPASIGKLVQLQILSASNCFSLVRLPGSVCELKALSVLTLDDAKILELPDSIGDLGELRRLSLRDCRGLGKLPESIGKLEDSLVELDISGTGISELPDSIKNLRSLKVLKMDSCFIRKFPCDIGELINLKEVHASWCRSLEGVIPSGISKLQCLRELRLRGTRTSNLPSEIRFMSSLQTLDLLHCDILKELPTLPSNLLNLYVNPDLKQKM